MTNQFKIGQKVFFVPIRYWEKDQPFETGTVVEQIGHDGTVYPTECEKANTVYCFHDGYGHNVFMWRDRTATTLKGAKEIRKRLVAERKAQEDAAMESLMARILKQK